MNLKALSLFSSAGVAETYFYKHGIDVKVASEILPERASLYKHLYPDVNMIQGDITDPSVFRSIIDCAQKESCDFIIATPPCQGMSSAGLMRKDDPRNRLILYVVEAIKLLKPKFVIIENVPEILLTEILIDDNWININTYLEKELSQDYFFNSRKKVNAMYYGVAQSRERCIYLLSRKDMGFVWEFPAPSNHITTLREAIGDLPSLDPDVTDISEEERNKLFPEYEKKRQAGLAVSKWHFPPKHKYRHVIAMMHTPEGCSAWSNQIYYPTLADGQKSKGFKNTYKRQWWDKPAYTVTKYTSRIGSQENGHPGTAIVDSEDEETRLWSDARVMTIFELMRVSSLPDDWNIPDKMSSNVLREVMGEGVPPRLIEHALIELEKTMKENCRFKKTVKALSLFANVGIAETYLKDIGIDVVVANELIEERARFYSHLYPQVNMIVGDITDQEVFDRVIAEAKNEGVEMLIATPPCQGMSCAGRKDPKDPRNFLIYYAIEAIKILRPRFVLLENVTMQQHTQILYNDNYIYIPEYVESELQEYYNINHDRIVNTMDYGIPQSRSRYVYLLTRKDENVKWEFPEKESHIITMREAIGDLPSLDPCLREESERWRFPDYEKKKEIGERVSKWHTPPVHSWKQVEWMIHTPSGTSAFKNEHYFPMTKGRRVKGAPRTYMRMFWEKPATTIMQNSGVISAFSTVHPGRCIVDSDNDEERIYSDARALTIYELLILSSLPLDWNIPDWADDVLIRKVIGEGIPPLLIKKFIQALIIGGEYDR